MGDGNESLLERADIPRQERIRRAYRQEIPQDGVRKLCGRGHRRSSELQLLKEPKIDQVPQLRSLRRPGVPFML